MKLLAALTADEHDSLFVTGLAKDSGLFGVTAVFGTGVHHHQLSFALFRLVADSFDFIEVKAIA